MNTIDAMKQAVLLLDELEPLYWDSSLDKKHHTDTVTYLKAAIAREEAQTVEPIGEVELIATGIGDEQRVNFRMYGSIPALGTKLFTHPAPPPSGERAALISELRLYAENSRDNVLCNELLFPAADMLAADAKDAWHSGRAEGIEECERLNAELQKRAQQVAVPQGYGELIRLAAWLLSPEPMRGIDALEENTHIGHRQFAAAQESMHEVLRLKAIEIKAHADMLSSEPQPPQAERVPMTDMVDAAMVEMQTMHPPMRRSDCERLIRAAIDAHHPIGVKP